ncbi:putative membrane protein YphA (DoxX/SURF4 family) [Streptomyces sp. SAI-218]
MTHGFRTDTHTPYDDDERSWRDSIGQYALLPLRIFLGVTFVYAGLDKLTDSAFMKSSGSGSIGDMMRSVRDSSAIPALVDLSLKNPVGFGYAIAFGELAVGIGTLLGILARLAALGGCADLAQPVADRELGLGPVLLRQRPRLPDGLAAPRPRGCLGVLRGRGPARPTKATGGRLPVAPPTGCRRAGGAAALPRSGAGLLPPAGDHWGTGGWGG